MPVPTNDAVEERVGALHQAVTELDSMIAKDAPASCLALAAQECEFYSLELADLSVRLREASRKLGQVAGTAVLMTVGL